MEDYEKKKNIYIYIYMDVRYELFTKIQYADIVQTTIFNSDINR